MTDALHALADAAGVATSYLDQLDRPVEVADDTVREVLGLLGHDASTDEAAAASLAALQEADAARLLAPTVAVRRSRAELGAARRLDAAVVDLEGGGTYELQPSGERLRVPPDVPTGVHRLRVQAGQVEDTVHLVVAPDGCPVPPGRSWGWMLQLYALRSARSWGMGDLGDLARLVDASGRELGAGFVVVNPLHAASPVEPQEPSPYYPSSRRFLNPLYVALEDLPEVRGLDTDGRERFLALAAEARALSAADRIDRDAVFRVKSGALALLAAVPRVPEREAAFLAFRAAGGAALEDFATFCALAEVHGVPFQGWPEELRHPAARAVADAAAALRERVDHHAWVQWLADDQKAAAQAAAVAAGMPVGVVHDLAVGVDPGGADAWALQDDLAGSATIGAPPDVYNQRGQDWRLPPFRPDRLLATGAAALREVLTATLRHAGGIRIDHVMGLFRLWWVPEGRSPAQGTYVRYPSDVLLAVLALEADRAGAIVVGEDLGTVEDRVRDDLRATGALSSRVLYFERAPADDARPASASDYPELALASVTTHDLPTAAGWWGGEWLRVSTELGLLGDGTTAEAEAQRTAAERAELRGLLAAEGLAHDDDSDQQLVEAMHAFLARTPCLLVAANLPDAVGDRRQPNMPGTTDAYPNWRLPVAGADGSPRALEDVLADPAVARVARMLGTSAT